ncbi:MAG: cupin domain-containing protein [Pseudomonadales bacterium]|jgi:mannose-6-phosphate isomerase-like protein (cupin superfamily)|nr:cupin domain-containing protein [Pseudomonadales bacterium]HJN51849.1 cupin domain-containing protein [Pseudomonadales bacterium]|tara:strand:- start:304 stop:645 length:342 start_codon:yes stop_codon:yes gene_type:complete
MAEKAWQVFHLKELQKNLKGDPVEYMEFMRVPSLSCGIYHLQIGSKDMQGPHDEDEIYYVLKGKAHLRVEDEDHQVEPGDVLYVRATSDHSFFEIKEDMTLLVFFASNSPGPR